MRSANGQEPAERRGVLGKHLQLLAQTISEDVRHGRVGDSVIASSSRASEIPETFRVCELEREGVLNNLVQTGYRTTKPNRWARKNPKR